MSDKICKYVSRKGKIACSTPADTIWGFCVTHANTSQSKKAKERSMREEKIRQDERRKMKEVEEYRRLKGEIPIPRQQRVEQAGRRKPIRRIHKNNRGRLQDPETGIVFNKSIDGSAIAIGQEDNSGNLIPLSDFQESWCRKKGVKYVEYEKSEAPRRRKKKTQSPPPSSSDEEEEEYSSVDDERLHTDDIDISSTDEDEEEDEEYSSVDDGRLHTDDIDISSDDDEEEDDFEYVYE